MGSFIAVLIAIALGVAGYLIIKRNRAKSNVGAGGSGSPRPPVSPSQD